MPVPSWLAVHSMILQAGALHCGEGEFNGSELSFGLPAGCQPQSPAPSVCSLQALQGRVERSWAG